MFHIKNSLRYKYVNFKRSNKGLSHLFKKYFSRKYDGIFDTALIASRLTFTANQNQFPDLAEKAFKITNPNFDPANYHNLNVENQVNSILGSAKGKYFELLIEKKLNEGERVGNLILPIGFEANLANSPNQKVGISL